MIELWHTTGASWVSDPAVMIDGMDFVPIVLAREVRVLTALSVWLFRSDQYLRLRRQERSVPGAGP